MARLKQEYAQLATEQEYFTQLADDLEVDPAHIKGNSRITSEHWLQFLQACRQLAEENRPIGIWFKLQAWLRYGFTNWKIYRQELATI